MCSHEAMAKSLLKKKDIGSGLPLKTTIGNLHGLWDLWRLDQAPFENNKSERALAMGPIAH